MFAVQHHAQVLCLRLFLPLAIVYLLVYVISLTLHEECSVCSVHSFRSLMPMFVPMFVNLLLFLYIILFANYITFVKHHDKCICGFICVCEGTLLVSCYC